MEMEKEKEKSIPPSSSLESDSNIHVQPKKRARERKVNPNPPAKRTSIYKGVTRHRCTGRFEAHLWDKDSWNSGQTKKGRQIYLGAYDLEEAAARTYDLAALKYWGPGSVLNFSIESYTNEFEEMEKVTKEEYLVSLRRKSSGFSRGVSKYRGVAKHHQNGRWEARIGRIIGNKYLYLGTYGSQEEAAIAYDIAAVEHRGSNAITNFDMSIYGDRMNIIEKPANDCDDPTEINAVTYGTRIKEQAEKVFDRIKQANYNYQHQITNLDQVMYLNHGKPPTVVESTGTSSTIILQQADHVPPTAPNYEEEEEEESLSHLCADPGSMNDHNSLVSVLGTVPTLIEPPRIEAPAPPPPPSSYVDDNNINNKDWIDEIDFVINIPVLDQNDAILLLFNNNLQYGYNNGAGFDDQLLLDDIILDVDDIISTPEPSSSESDQYA